MTDESNSGYRRITASLAKYVCREFPAATPESDIDPGYYTPYAEFLEDEIEAITEILGQLILEYGEHKSIDGLLDRIEKWMGDDWHVDLSDEDQKRLDKIKRWTYG